MSAQQQTFTNQDGSVERTGTYGDSESMSAIIAPAGATSITLQFTSIETEECCDFVTIKSCTTPDCLQSTQIGRYSGTTIQGPVTSDTGIMLIRWDSDSSVSGYGWSADWSTRMNGGSFSYIRVTEGPN